MSYQHVELVWCEIVEWAQMILRISGRCSNATGFADLKKEDEDLRSLTVTGASANRVNAVCTGGCADTSFLDLIDWLRFPNGDTSLEKPDFFSDGDFSLDFFMANGVEPIALELDLLLAYL
eukprot:m.12309 g.12309  ORF g.12309 m.12309 type:complete len:121 (-) comp5818_c0_seq2:122-484(-)